MKLNELLKTTVCTWKPDPEIIKNFLEYYDSINVIKFNPGLLSILLGSGWETKEVELPMEALIDSIADIGVITDDGVVVTSDDVALGNNEVSLLLHQFYYAPWAGIITTVNPGCYYFVFATDKKDGIDIYKKATGMSATTSDTEIFVLGEFDK